MDLKFPNNLDEARRSAVMRSAKVSRWLDRIQDGFDVRRVEFVDVFFFGDKVGFVMARAEAYLDGEPVPGLTLIRGDSVAVLVVLVTPDGREYTVLTRQPRLPVGETSYEEIPAGMIDEGAFVSKAIDELVEEVGADLEIAVDDLVPLETIHSSPGGSDEAIAVFCATKHVSSELIDRLQGRVTGNVDEHEKIRVEVIPLEDLSSRATHDAKSRVAYYAYMARMGMVAKPNPAHDGIPGSAGPRI